MNRFQVHFVTHLKSNASFGTRFLICIYEKKRCNNGAARNQKFRTLRQQGLDSSGGTQRNRKRISVNIERVKPSSRRVALRNRHHPAIQDNDGGGK